VTLAAPCAPSVLLFFRDRRRFESLQRTGDRTESCSFLFSSFFLFTPLPRVRPYGSTRATLLGARGDHCSDRSQGQGLTVPSPFCFFLPSPTWQGLLLRAEIVVRVPATGLKILPPPRSSPFSRRLVNHRALCQCLWGRELEPRAPFSPPPFFFFFDFLFLWGGLRGPWCRVMLRSSHTWWGASWVFRPSFLCEV